MDRLVKFHKAVGDVTRIRIIALLRNGPLHGQAIAGKLGVTPPTISHHMMKLKESDLIYERRDKNTIYFYLNEKSLAIMATAILKVGDEGEKEEYSMDLNEKATIIRNFFDRDGTLKQIPSQRKKKLVILEHLAKGLSPAKKYTEIEISEYIKQYHPDFATIRREFVANQFMYREKDIYELNPPEMWSK